MEQTQVKKFVCKFCNKRYPCGKSLGGHIRTHMNNYGESESDELISINKLLSNGRIIKRSVIESEADGAYVLRENPKKTKRFFSDSSGMICKECGKEFPSLKALCGHMACHSEKDRIFVEKQKQLVMDSQSDTETSSTPSKRRRSKRIRYNKANGVYDSIMANDSSSVSEIEQEQEEVAMSLMMLSRDSSGYCNKGLNSIGDHSSDNHSVVLEAKSSSIDVRITINNNNKVTKCKTLSTSRGSRLGSKKKKGHECPFCFRVFKSGQALGGHKRSHFVGGGSEDRTLVIKQDSPEMSTATVIDLNLPAPVE